MNLTTGQFPDQPGIDRATKQSVDIGYFHVLQNPIDFGSTEVGIQRQTGLGADQLRVLDQRLAAFSRSPALPDDGVIDGVSGFAIPDDGGFTLIGNPNGVDWARRFGQGGGDGVDDRLPNVFGIMFDPAGLRVVLFEFAIGIGDDLSGGIIDDRPGSRCALIDGQNAHVAILIPAAFQVKLRNGFYNVRAST